MRALFLMRALSLAVLVAGLCLGQAADEGKPATSNIAGAEYPRVHGDLSVCGMGGQFDPKTAYNGVLADAAAFNKRVKLVWIGIGTAEPERMYKSVNSFHEALTQAGIQHIYYESPGLLMSG